MKELLLGNEAIARGAWEAGATVSTAYPGTPSTEITEELAKFSEIYCEWSPNEKVALEVALGASMGGARAICCMKHVGVNVAADPLFTAAYTGVNGGLVLIAADDPGMHSSQNEQDSRFYARSAHVPMLEPSSSEECLLFTKKAFELSENYDSPVMLRLVTRIAHARSLVQPGQREETPLKPYEKNPRKYVMMPGFARGRHVAVEAREKRLLSEISALGLNKIEWNDPSLGVICSGSAYNYVKEALPAASVLKLGLVYPLDVELIKEFAQKVEKLVVVEELEPFFEEQIKALGLPVSGKEKTGLQGELFSRKLGQLFGAEAPAGPAETPNLPQRPPVLCPGCPHRAVFHVLRKMNFVVAADIGCYTLGALPPLNAVDSVVCMGASIGMAMGLEKARGRDFAQKTVSVIGDSTFVHSGITGLIDLVYNKGNSTVIIVDNSTTGMTGHQPNPTTGQDIHFRAAPQLSLERLCEAVGVQSVKVVDPFDLAALEGILKEETAKDGPSVVIARRPCALLSREKKPPLRVKAEACIRCGACLRIGCPAISMGQGGLSIDPALCVGCGLCAGLCPKSAIEGGTL
ncbi:MAG: indolepyruvate ferredoxin oxidoreductase subunit alpha [Christensenellaceae bacterium]|jgi:indolepyruvate ferredoxin oxidoreductase alpha subunit|nr:indolepyruvate ferredoxin oxidoreductase subunit alpha [Christensenellaceae bacterium]